MGRRLAVAVYVDDPVTRQRIILQPGDEPSPELAELITHPDAWDAVPPVPGDPDSPGAEQPDTSAPVGPEASAELEPPDAAHDTDPLTQEAQARKPGRRKPPAEQ